MTIIKRLNEKVGYTEGESVLADYILKNAELVLNYSIRELSQQAFTSTSTIFRLCQKLGLSGYKEFVIKLSRDLESQYNNLAGIDANFPFSRVDSDLLVAKKIAALSSETITQTHLLLTESMLNQAVDLIVQAESIFGIGVSHSFNRAVDFQTKMLRIDYYVKLMPLQADQFHLANHGTAKDVAIIISYGGTTAEILSDAKLLKKKGCKLIVVTSNSEGDLARMADGLLPLPKNEDADLNISTFSSQIATEFVLNVLYSCVYKRNYLENIKKNKNAPTSYLLF
ncbi:MurR/RpiR family transcriptional regulator [uncultured Vagococcus sp.]|uniref:MurR/RpiR family transcriptional regulator n=1 Tax=uncultured Vagococcus sp. TaxID=189676 RepID=UPI0028D7C5D8|nr:MurR/RpiR family transcriptional regulator [uncultured Vagococcus sp.]